MSKIPSTQGLLFLVGWAAMAGVVLVLIFAPSYAQPTLDNQESGSGRDMKITRINQFPANPGSSDELYELISSFLPLIRGSDGCIDAQLLRGIDNPDKIVVIEVWRDQEAHRASAKNMPPGTFEKAMALMSGPPSGGYYH